MTYVTQAAEYSDPHSLIGAAARARDTQEHADYLRALLEVAEARQDALWQAIADLECNYACAHAAGATAPVMEALAHAQTVALAEYELAALASEAVEARLKEATQ